MHHQGLALADIASVVAKLKMYPYFDVANYILMCMMVREDAHQPSSDSALLSRRHPLASWLSSMLMCFASVILTNFILGEPPISPFTNHQDILTASIVWYVINYSPFDISYKLCKFLPFKLIIYCMKEVQRAGKVHHGVHFALKVYPEAPIIVCFVGVLKGAGYYYMRIIERLVRGTWIPNSNEILHPSLATKACLIASIAFLLDHEGYMEIPHNLLHLYVVLFFVLFRIVYLVIGIHNPFYLFEKVFCAIIFGGFMDSVRRLMASRPAAAKAVDGEPRMAEGQEDAAGGKPSTGKAKEE